LRVFSGKVHPTPKAQAVFFCYRMPFFRDETWTIEGGPCKWFLVPLSNGSILEEPTAIAEFIRSTPETNRVCKIDRAKLKQVRKTIEERIKDGYMKQVQAVGNLRPKLLCWMELN